MLESLAVAGKASTESLQAELQTAQQQLARAQGSLHTIRCINYTHECFLNGMISFLCWILVPAEAA